MATEYVLAERERIRWALLEYMKAHKIGVPTLAARIKASHPREMEIPVKTLQRFLAGMRTHDMALTICKAFVEKLPNRPTAMHALGETLHAVYGKPADNLAGIYAVRQSELPPDSGPPFTPNNPPISELTITDPGAGLKFLIATEVRQSPYRIYDGVLVFTGANILAILKDRLMETARIHALHRELLGPTFYGILYDNGPLEHFDYAGPQYLMWQTSVARTDHA